MQHTETATDRVAANMPDVDGHGLPEPYYDRDGITIYQGDAREILPHLEPGSIDLVLTDPPYQSLNIAVSVGTTTRLVSPDKFTGKRLSLSTGKRWFETVPSGELGEILRQCQTLLRQSGALYVFADVKSGLEIFPTLRPANVLVWDKGHFGMGFNWRRQHEWIAYCPMPEHKLRSAALGDVLTYPGVVDKQHPTEKPVSVLRVILRNSTDIGDTVIDPFMGTGSALIAARDMNRRAVGVELREDYIEIAVKRLQQSVLPLEVSP